MRKLIFLTTLLSIIIGSSLYSQSVPDSIYYNRLYYTGKVWGYVKYFHSEVAKGNINWDMKLIETVLNFKSDISNQDFNESLLNMIDMAGEMALPTFWLPTVPDTLKYNLNLNWFNDSIFSDEVRARLDTIKTRFRKQNNYYVGKALAPKFDNDSQFHEWGVNQYPDDEYRLLALFRYWNIINYFYPYKYMMDQNWDSTFVEFIPKIIYAYDDMSYHLTFLELFTRLNDSHASGLRVPFDSTSSEIIDSDIIGNYYLPLTLKQIENETIITGVFIDDVDIEVGDIIKSINGHNIYVLRDSLRKYTAGSNSPVIERNINTKLLRGSNETVQMTYV